ncbi:MAG TPA: 2-oxoacid:acceptor oxidoreductase family protein [Dictyoglomaceae bacterium]|nr:2-oxoacid:acceptor oxidoreductase family protein [Dictyoglomaceae bacterium]HOL39408.1 2-oxoacid:acceptor oxidoreductase family protein [Dictyoglomaceae bacterium]HOP95108.1 2-oxoacid:acceptor oxidoreductase family protein [Dictyoglomaceae bacterium]HPP16186.1 2-oxoacid:acceptor oxidoreductase family protein [Dictyoglomaceae bacterium]HPU43696.1 2-oxoacid:acceptor oxidoreductase family protein [Dictyoglomaceae bacterium]
MKELLEIRWHARAGQGAKTASYLLAETAMEAGKFIQAFPEYGPERTGAPMKAYTRISTKPIRIHSQVYNPDAVVVLDKTLIGKVDIIEGLPSDGIILVNTTDDPKTLRQELGISDRKIYTVDATGIALATIGRPIPNTPMLGALIRVLPIISLDEVLAQSRKKFEVKFKPEVVEGNLQAIKRAYEEVKGE